MRKLLQAIALTFSTGVLVALSCTAQPKAPAVKSATPPPTTPTATTEVVLPSSDVVLPSSKAGPVFVRPKPTAPNPPPTSQSQSQSPSQSGASAK